MEKAILITSTPSPLLKKQQNYFFFFHFKSFTAGYKDVFFLTLCEVRMFPHLTCVGCTFDQIRSSSHKSRSEVLRFKGELRETSHIQQMNMKTATLSQTEHTYHSAQ